MLIPDEVISRITAENDIVDVIGQFVSLQKKGNNYFGLCPFHQENTPSFSVSPSKGIYKCFSCKEGGNVVTFIQKHLGKNYIESIRYLAERVNIDLSRYLKNSSYENLRPYYDTNRFASDFYSFYIKKTKFGEEAIKYLNDRGIEDEIISRFDIGLAPHEYDHLYKALKKNNYTDLIIKESGLVTETSNNNIIDRFRDRIIFPIKDNLGNIVGFSGRIFKDPSKDISKYSNSPETKVFQKGKILYNFSDAKKYISKNKTIYIFEGFMDVIAAVRAGVNESVATMGTALTEYHAETLRKVAENIVICFDGDEAGVEATKRAIMLLRKYKVNIYIVNLPGGLDPDEYINKYNSDKLKSLLENNRLDLYEYYYLTIKDTSDLNSIYGKELFKEKIFKLISTIKSEFSRSEYLKKLADDLNTSVDTLNNDFNGIKRKRKNNNIRSNKKVEVLKVERNANKKALETIIMYMILDNRFVNKLNEEVDIIFFDNVDIYYKIKSMYLHNEETKINIDKLNDYNLSADIIKVIEEAIKNCRDFVEEKIDKEAFSYPNEFYDCIKTRKKYYYDFKYKELKKLKDKSSLTEYELDQMLKILQIKNDLSKNK